MARAARSQEFVPVTEVRNGVMVLKDGGYRGVLMCSSVNFSLKSADEQRAIISGFQTFLNTLDFSIQIVVHSRNMDIRPYLDLLKQREEAPLTDLLRIQLREYIEFVRSFTDGANIMTKTFYVVVPYAPTGLKPTQALAGLLSRGDRERSTKDAGFGEHRSALEQRMALVSSGLTAAGVRAIPLGTEELIELLYRSFNPGEIDNPVRLEA